MYVSACFNALGNWIRFASKDHFVGSLMGTLTVALAQLWFLPAPALITDRWFPQEERTLATSIAVGSNITGFSIGFLIASTVVKDGLPEQINNLLLYSAIWNSAPLLVVLAGMRENPKHFRNPISTIDNDFSSIKPVFCKPKNALNLVLVGMLIGFTWTYQSLIDIILKPFDYSVLQIGYIGMIQNTTGTIGSIIASIYLEKQLVRHERPKYDLIIKLFYVLSFILSLLLWGIIYFVSDRFPAPLAVLIVSFIGLGQSASTPFIAQAFLENAFPCNELMAFNAVFYVPQLTTFVLNILVTFGVGVINLIMVPVILYLIFIYRTIPNRFLAE